MQLPYRVRQWGYRAFGRVPVRVRSGINRGALWSLASTGRGYGSGRFGRERLEALAAVVEPGECFWDLGAHKGFMTLAASRMVGPHGTVVAVEPGGDNLRFLRRHVRWNDAANVRVIAAAVGDRPGAVPFGGRGDTLAFRVGQGEEMVEIDTLPRLIDRHALPAPTALKMDIEGREAAVLEASLPSLPDRLVALVSIHDRPLHAACTELLAGHGYTLYESREMALRTSGELPTWGGDHDLLAIGPGRAHDPARVRALSLIAG